MVKLSFESRIEQTSFVVTTPSVPLFLSHFKWVRRISFTSVVFYPLILLKFNQWYFGK